MHQSFDPLPPGTKGAHWDEKFAFDTLGLRELTHFLFISKLRFPWSCQHLWLFYPWGDHQQNYNGSGDWYSCEEREVWGRFPVSSLFPCQVKDQDRLVWETYILWVEGLKLSIFGMAAKADLSTGLRVGLGWVGDGGCGWCVMWLRTN